MGRVRSVDRVVVTSKGRRQYPSRILTGHLSLGYWRVGLTRNGKSVKKLVHRLVLEAFTGPCPDGMEGCHNDGDRANSRLVNLRWDDRSGNNLDKREHGTDHQLNKTHCPRGHELIGPNLVNQTRSHPERSCRACARERARARHIGEPFSEALADEQYEKLMDGTATVYACDKTHCPRGHALEEPNLVASALRSGSRTCLACSRERARAHKRKEPFNESSADQKYAEIMSET